MLDLNDAVIFVQVVRSGSFAEAARRLGLPPNTVSRRVQQLEAHLGTRLLQRSTRKLTLTSAGQGFHERCAGGVDGLLEAGQELMTGSSEPSGLVRVAATADFFDFFPMEWVAEFLAAHPRVRLDFVLSDAKADLIAEQIDVAFRGGPLHDSGYVGRQILGPCSDGMVASPAYIAARGSPHAAEPGEPRLCDLRASQRPRHMAFGRPKWRGRSASRRALQRQYCAGTAQGHRGRTRHALLPPAMAKLDVQAGVLVPVLPQYQRTGYGMSVLYPSRRHLPLAVPAFIGLVIQKMNAADAPEVHRSVRRR